MTFLFGPQGAHRVDRGGAPGWHYASSDRYQEQQQRRGEQRERIARASFRPRGNHAVQRHAQAQTGSDAEAEHGPGGSEHQANDARARSAQGHANPDFLRALGHREGDHAVETRSRERQREYGEEREHVAMKRSWPQPAVSSHHSRV